jgi:hypothetical protein
MLGTLCKPGSTFQDTTNEMGAPILDNPSQHLGEKGTRTARCQRDESGGDG